MGLADLKRVTDLFIEGTEVVFPVPDGEPVLLWVNKLNPFQVEECQRDGRAARSRVVLAIKDKGTAEYLTFEATMSEMDQVALVEAVLDQRNNTRFLDAVDDMRRDKEWIERIEAAGRLTSDMSDAEREQVVKINEEYADELQKCIDARRDSERLEMIAMDRASMEEEYRKGWLEGNGYNAFQREYTKTNLFYSVRLCQGVRTPVGSWDHTACNGHQQRALDDREESTQLPSGMVTALVEACREVEVPNRDARFSDAPPSSSESSVQQNEPEESTPSTQEVIRPEPVTIS